MSATRYRYPLVLMAALLTGAASAGNIYKWTDDEGNVHYGDRPTAEGSVERLDIVSRSTDAEQVASLVEAHQEARETARQQAAEAAAEEQSAEEQRKAEAERAEQCAKFQERLQQFVQSRRLYREDESGERVYLDEEEMLAARNRVQEQVQEYCSN